MKNAALTDKLDGMRVYISGAITGNDNAKIQFDRIEKICNANGAVEVFNPMADWVQVLRREFTYEEHMRRDINKLTCGCVDILVQIPGWDLSKGAAIESDIADACGIPRIEVQP